MSGSPLDQLCLQNIAEIRYQKDNWRTEAIKHKVHWFKSGRAWECAEQRVGSEDI